MWWTISVNSKLENLNVLSYFPPLQYTAYCTFICVQMSLQDEH